MTKYATWAGYSKKKDVSLFPVVDDKEIEVDLELLQELVKHRSASYTYHQDIFGAWLVEYIQTHVPKAKVETDKHGNIYVTKGKSKLYPCLLGHMDCNIDESINEVLMVRAGDWLLGVDLGSGEQTNPGFDDKIAVLFMLQMLKKLDIVKCLITTNEEVGGQGAYASDKTFFKNCTMIAQLDRNAYAGPEFISYSGGIEMCSDEFMDAAKSTFDKYGYFDSIGMFTDANCIKSDPSVDCIAFNTCASYFDEHCPNEVCYVPALENAFNFVYELVINYGHVKWHHVSPQKKYSGGGWGQKSYFKGDKGEWPSTSSSGTKKGGDVKVGDTVKVVSETTHKGRIAKVASIIQGEWPIEVHFGDKADDWACYNQDELEVLNVVPGKEYKDWEDWEEIDEAKGKAKKEAPAFGQQWINGVQYAADKDVDYDEAQEMIDSGFCPCCEQEDTLTVDIDNLAYCHSCNAYYNIPEWYSQNQEI